MLKLHRLLNLMGMVVDGLAAHLMPLSLPGYGAVRPEKQAAALAIQRTTGILHMGMGLLA